ncbi:hypothetical protein [Streptobacillus moniliformis]|uniref:hypothetical protein n=1 Tax=Streptobacillus moniliformis TaxID=34105 RepID=UPI0007E43149|nr:hypothetical protein [Streptobacillus moniliformis]
MDIKDTFINKFNRYFDKKEMVKEIERGVVDELRYYGCYFRDISWKLEEQDDDLEIIKDYLEKFEEYLNNELIEIETVKEEFQEIYNSLTDEQIDEIEEEMYKGKTLDFDRTYNNIDLCISEINTYFDLLNTWKKINEELINNIDVENEYDIWDKENIEIER